MTVSQFQEQISSMTSIPVERQEFRSGFPPTPLRAPSSAAETTISAWGVCKGDTVLVSAAAPARHETPTIVNSDDLQMSEDEMMARAIAASLGQDIPAEANGRNVTSTNPVASTTAGRSVTNGSDSGAVLEERLPSGRCVVRRVVDSDNSCLFNALGYNLERSRNVAAKLRRVVAQTVAADEFTFNEGFLGKSNAEYQTWILNPLRWGGGIELYILSRHFEIEIAAYDIQTQRVDVYGQECKYRQRCMVVYDGLHYDALAVSSGPQAPETTDCTLLDTSSPDLAEISKGATELVRRMHNSRKFTDTANFTLRCGVCQQGLKGEKEAVAHAKQTGHQNFQEY